MAGAAAERSGGGFGISGLACSLSKLGELAARWLVSWQACMRHYCRCSNCHFDCSFELVALVAATGGFGKAVGCCGLQVELPL
jgi:hypothetical protein